MMNNPKVSIITVVYNDVSNIEKTIRNTLKQSYSNMEYIVLDGGSTDGTLDVIKKYQDKIIWKSEKDNGIYDAMYKGVKMATGEWILFRNSGDFFFNETVIADVFSKYEDRGEGLIIGNIRYFKNGWIKDIPPHILTKHYYEAMPAHHPSTFIRRTLQLENPFPAKYKQSSDYWFFVKVLKDGVCYKYINMIFSLYDNITGASTDRYDVSLMENADILESFGAPKELVDSRKKRSLRISLIRKKRAESVIYNFIYQCYYFYKVIILGGWKIKSKANILKNV